MANPVENPIQVLFSGPKVLILIDLKKNLKPTSPPQSAPSSSSDGNTSNVKYNVGGGSAGNRGVQTVNQ